MSPDQPVPVPGLTGDQAQRWAAVQPGDDARVLVGDSPERDAVVAGLRALAGYLAANPAVPIPPRGWDVSVHAEGTDSEQFSQVDLVSEIMGEHPVDQRAATGHHHVERSSGRSPAGSSAYRNGGWPSTTRGSRTQTRWSRISPRQSQPAWPPPHSPPARRPPPRFPGRSRGSRLASSRRAVPGMAP